MQTLRVDQQDEVHSGRRRRYMHTRAQVTASGAVLGMTRIWTRQPWLGFTGAVRVLALDPNDVILDYTGEHWWGVDGFRIPFKQSDRDVMWFDRFDLAKAEPATRLMALHYHAAINRLPAILQEAQDTAQRIRDFLDEVGKLPAPA